MRVVEPILLEAFADLGVERLPAQSMARRTSLGIGGITDVLVIRRRRWLPELLRLLDAARIPCRLLGGGTNLVVSDGELPWVALRLARSEPTVRVDRGWVWLDAAEDLGRAVTTCARANFGGMEGLIGVPGTVGGALRMNAGAYGTEIGPLVREMDLYRAAAGKIETLPAAQVGFQYRHSSLAGGDVLLGACLELPERPYREIVDRIHVCNFKRRSSQPLTQKTAGCVFQNPPGQSAGKLIESAGLKGFRIGSAMVSEQHANFFVNLGRATCADMLRLIEHVRGRVAATYGVELREEVILWVN